MNQPQHSKLDATLRAIWRREQFVHLTRGALTAVAWGVGLFLAAVLIDWMIRLPAVIRAGVLIGVVGVTLYRAWQAGWSGLRPFESVRAALQLERIKGGMESLLVSAVQFRTLAATSGQVQLVCEKADRVAEAIRPGDAVGLGALRRPAVVTSAVALLLAVIALSNSGLLIAGFGRIFTPWQAIQYPTRTELIIADGDLVVQEGRPVSIVAQVSKIVPKAAKIAIRTGTGEPLVRALPISEGRCEYAVETAYRSFDYQITAGDAQSAWHRVEVIHAPSITRADVTLNFPTYTQRPPETVNALTLTVPETTRVRWTLALDRPVSEAIMNLDGQDPMPMEISDDGLTVSVEQAALESRAYRFSWVDRDHGFSFSSLSNFLQVAPDREPRVELTAPANNLYATLGREVVFAFRGRDDHGIGESVIAYRIDKTEETKVTFEPTAPIDGSEQSIDWDYRRELPDLAVGQTVAFALELADRYPGPDGPHRVRSETRLIQFISRENYLEQFEKQVRRQLSALKALYREERKVHEAVLRLDPADPVFVQTCQLEAVRQDLMRERANGLAQRMQELIDDLAANHITDHAGGEALNALREQLLQIASETLAANAPALRELAGQAGKAAPGLAAAKAIAVEALDNSARELGLLVLQLGYTDASEVMAREFHAAAATQAALRLRTIVQQEEPTELADSQKRLMLWLNRLFAATPQNRESTVEEALIAFTLSRVVKEMIQDDFEPRLQQAAELIRQGAAADASRLQAEAIQALLNAEARLRIGAERDALATAFGLFASVVAEQAKIREALASVEQSLDSQQQATFVANQEALHRKLQLLLLPHVPARRVRLFEERHPLPPPVADLLGTADEAMKRAAAAIRDGDRQAAQAAQAMVENSFQELASITKSRIAALTQVVRLGRLRFSAEEMGAKFDRYADRLNALIEETEDAADNDDAQSSSLIDRQRALADTVRQQQDELNIAVQDGGTPSEQSLALPDCLGEIVQYLRQAEQALQTKNLDAAIAYQSAALDVIPIAKELLLDHQARIGPYGGILTIVQSVEIPSPFVTQIIEEQRDLLKRSREAKDDDLPALAISQKNLVHAVNAVLEALASVSKSVGSDTVMLFAKEDMEAAADALLAKDRLEAIDAQEYIVETLEQLREKIDEVVPQYHYLLEIIEAVYGASHEGIRLQEMQRRLRQQTAAGAEANALAAARTELKLATESYAELIQRITGIEVGVAAMARMEDVETSLAEGSAAAAKAMAQVENALAGDAASVMKCLKHLGLVPDAPTNEEKTPESALLKKVLAIAAKHNVMFRESCGANEQELKNFETALREFEQALDPFIAIAQTHKNRPKPGAVEPVEPLPPANLHLKLVAAKQAFGVAATAAAAGDRAETVANQIEAASSLRHFIIEYALKFLAEAGFGVPPPPPAVSTVLSDKQDELELFIPGGVGGKVPPDSRADWEVLGKRQRAALNENFARELPLEHREILKNYFERLTQ